MSSRTRAAPKRPAAAAASRLVLCAPAKVNLHIEVLRRRPDGYHDIRSVLVPVSLCDGVVIEPADGPIETSVTFASGRASATGSVPPGDGNLATRAARLLRERTGCKAGARIRLIKRIPLGGGLGGGSADAAAVLRGLNRLWNTGMDEEALRPIALELGCDVPALLQGGAVLAEGVGERVSRIPTPWMRRRPWWMVIANPGFCVSTADVYSRCTPPLTRSDAPATSMVSALEEGDLERAAAGLFNGLQDTVFRKYPLIQMLAEQLAECGALGVLLSGSGASVFGLARDRKHAAAVSAALARGLSAPAWCAVARTLPDGVMAAHGPLEA